MTPENQRRAIQRTTGNDLMALATESAAAPMQVAAILVLDRPVDTAALRAALAGRISALPRLGPAAAAGTLRVRPTYLDR